MPRVNHLGITTSQKGALRLITGSQICTEQVFDTYIVHKNLRMNVGLCWRIRDSYMEKTVS